MVAVAAAFGRKAVRLRVDGLPVILMFADMLLWTIVSMVESNPAILVVHVLFLVMSIIVLRVMNSPPAARIFYLALLVRTVFTIIAWYTAYDLKRRFMLGTNEDSSRFWYASLLPLQDAMVSFADPFFPAIGHYLVETGKVFGLPAYLASDQSVIFSGSFFCVFSYTLIRDLYGEKVGRPVGYLMVFCLAAIAYSTALMRDSLIGMFGFLFLTLVNRLLMPIGMGRKLLLLPLLAGGAVALMYLRLLSLGGFLVAAGFIIFTGTKYRPNPLSLRLRSSLVVAMVAGFTVLASANVTRLTNMLLFSSLAREGLELGGNSLNQEGITGKISSYSPLLLMPIAPLALVQPMPFYTWKAPDRTPGPPAFIDMVLGFAGLQNQLLLGFFVVGLRLWWNRRESLGLAMSFYTFSVCAASLVALGQTRMVMEHCYPFFYSGIVLACLHLRSSGYLANATVTWFLALVALYAGYESLGDKDFMLAFLLAALVAAACLLILWQMAGRRRPVVALGDPQTFLAGKY